jgi:hypothetical protein
VTSRQHALYLGSAILGWILGAVAFWFLTGCRPAVQVKAPEVVQVKIVEMPERPGCLINEPPVPPMIIELNYEDEEILRRSFVHYLKGNELIEYDQRVYDWANEVRDCVYMMLGQEP